MSIHTYFRIYNLDPTISLSRLSLSPLVFLPLAASIKADSHYKFVCNGCITFNSFTDIFERSTSWHVTWDISSSVYALLPIAFLKHEIKFSQSIAPFDESSSMFIFMILWLIGGLAIKKLLMSFKGTYSHWSAVHIPNITTMLGSHRIRKNILNIKELSLISIHLATDLTLMDILIDTIRIRCSSMIATWRYGSKLVVSCHKFINLHSSDRIKCTFGSNYFCVKEINKYLYFMKPRWADSESKPSRM